MVVWYLDILQSVGSCCIVESSPLVGVNTTDFHSGKGREEGEGEGGGGDAGHMEGEMTSTVWLGQ